MATAATTKAPPATPKVGIDAPPDATHESAPIPGTPIAVIGDEMAGMLDQLERTGEQPTKEQVVEAGRKADEKQATKSATMSATTPLNDRLPAKTAPKLHKEAPAKSDEEPDKEGEKPEASAAAQTQAPEQSDDPSAGYQRAKELRAAYNAQNAELKRAVEEGNLTKKERDEMRGRLAELETAAKRAQELATELEEARKSRNELEERVKTLDYTQSSEFHDKYHKPVVKALENAYQDLDEMLVQEADGTMRKATKEDFQAIVGMPLHEALKRAKEQFGDLAETVMARRREVVTAQRARHEAMKNASGEAETRLRQLAEQQQQRVARLQATFKAKSDEILAKHPQIFKAPDGDQELQKAWSDGHALADLALQRDPNLSDEDFMATVAQVKHRAGAFPMALVQIQRLQGELAEARKMLAAYEKSEPSGGEGATGRASSAPDPLDFGAQLVALANVRR